MCKEALAGHLRDSSARRWWGLSAEAELRVHFQRALRWRSNACAHAAGGREQLAGAVMRPMAAFVVETYASLCGRLVGARSGDAALSAGARHPSVSSELQWQLLALLVLADEVCAALGSSNVGSAPASRRLGDDTDSSVVSECIVAVTAAQLCALRHVGSHVGVADATTTGTGRSEANAREATAEARYRLHAARATRRLVESLLILCHMEPHQGAALLPPERSAACAMCSLDCWLGQQLCCLAGASCGPSHAVSGHSDEGEAFSAPLLLLLRLLVQSTSWLDRVSSAEAESAPYIRRVCAAVLLIEGVVARATEGAQTRCADTLRGALQLSRPLVREDGGVESVVPSCTVRSPQRTQLRSQLFHESTDAEGLAAPLPAVTGCFVCTVLDSCAPSTLRLLLFSGTPSQRLQSETSGPEEPADWELAAEVMMLLAPGMALSMAWRHRHTRAVQSMLCTSAVPIAMAAKCAGAVEGAGTTASVPGHLDAAAHSVLLQRCDALKQVCHRLSASAGSDTFPALEPAALLLPWSQQWSSPFLCFVFSQLHPPAVARMAEAVLERLVPMPSLFSAVPHEAHSGARRAAAPATRPNRKEEECRGAGEVVGTTRHQLAVLALHSTLASASSEDVRAEVAQVLLSRLCAVLTRNACTMKRSDADLTRMRVHVACLCLAVLLACTSTSPRDQAAAMHQLLTALTSLADDGEHPPHSRREGDDVYAVLHSWCRGALGDMILARHAQLSRWCSLCVRGAPAELRSNEAPYGGPLRPPSPADHLAAWWEDQPRLRKDCNWTGARLMRLCNTAAHLAATPTATPIVPSPRQLPGLPAFSVADAEAAKVACTAAYDTLSLEQLCHLALASAAPPLLEASQTAPTAGTESSTTSARPPTPLVNRSCVCALVTTEGGALLLGSDLSSEVGVRSIFRHTATQAQAREDGALNVLQHHQGRLLTDRQRQSLVKALRDFSQRRSVKEAVALFYALERQHRRLQLAEAELFAETARRAPLVFLVRLLLYVPPPCKSAVLARAIIAGAWKAYQRALQRHSRQVAEAAVEETWPGGQREKLPIPSRLRRLSRRRIEQAWYESLAVALRALALIPSTSAADGPHEEQHRALSLLQRLVYARPRSMQPLSLPRPASSSSAGAAVPADEWDSGTVQGAQLLTALLRSSPWSGAPHTPHEPQKAALSHSVKTLCQIVQLCDANGDSVTAMRAYLRVANSHALPPPAHSHPPSSAAPVVAAHDSAKQIRLTAHAHHAQVIPLPLLLPLETCISLVHLASMHVAAACDEGAVAHAIRATAASGEHHQESSEAFAPGAPSDPDALRSGTALVEDSFDRRVGRGDAETKARPYLRAALEAGAVAPSDAVTESAAEIARLASTPARGGTRGGNVDRANDKATPVTVATVATADDSHVMEYAANCIAAVQRLSPTLPDRLRRVLDADSALIPLTAALHDALQWCRLRPRSMPAREGATIIADGLDTASLHLLADHADSDNPAAVDVVTPLLAALFQLEGAEMSDVVNVAPLHPVTPFAANAAAIGTVSDAGAAMEEVEGRETSCMVVVVTRRTFLCRAARANLDVWRLVRHADVLLSYTWDYVWELYRMESTVLWVSPAQQQRAYLAVAECAQVIVAALQALDVWAVEMLAHEARQRGYDDNQGDELPSLRTTGNSVPTAPSSEWGLQRSVDEWRGRLRSEMLERVLVRLLNDSDLPDAAVACRGEKALATLPCCLPSWGRADTTSAAIAHLLALIQHSRTALENCSPSKALMQLAGDSLRGGVATTQQFCDALSPLMHTSLAGVDGARAMLPVHLSHLALDSLSYVLHCVTVAAMSPRPPQTIAALAELEIGGIAALLARVAAAEGVLQHTASLVEHALLRIELTDFAPHTADAQLLRTLWCLSATLKYTAVLLDECMAWWTLLDLEAATATAPPSELLQAIDTSGRNCGGTFTSARMPPVSDGVLADLRAQLRRLAAAFADLYALGWCGGVHAHLPEDFRARLWSRDESRAQHLHVCLALHHLTGASGDAAVSSRLTGVAEALEQALALHPSASAVSGSRRGSAIPKQSGSIDMDAFIRDRDEGVTEAARRTALVATRTIERMLLAYLALRKGGAGVAGRTPGPVTLVSITAVEASLQRALMHHLPLSQRALLWRLFPVLIDDGCHAPSVYEATPDGASGDAPQSMSCETAVAEERPWGAMCAVPTAVWRQLVRLGEGRESMGSDGALRSGTASEDASVMHSERLVVYAALLSRRPLVLAGVVCHPLVRHHQLAETLREQRQQVQVGASSASAAGVSKGMSCEWLKRLLLYGAEDDTIEEAKLAASGEAGEPALPIVGATVGSPLNEDGGGGSLCTSLRGPLPFLLSHSMREQFVSVLTLAVLRDASLICVDHVGVPLAAAANAAGGAAACPPSLSQPSSFMSPLAVEALVAQKRERMLMELVQHLGYVAPHALRTAFQWITGTPYPPKAREPLSSVLSAEEVPQAELEGITLSCVDATSLRRVQVALLSCGPWPTGVARALLEYAARVHVAAPAGPVTQAHSSGDHTTKAPFSETRELYRELKWQPDKEQYGVDATSRALAAAAQLRLDATGGVRMPSVRRSLQHHSADVGGSPLRERHENSSDASASCFPAGAAALPSSAETSGSKLSAHYRANHFRVGSSPRLLPEAAEESSCVDSTRQADYPSADVPLSAIQLACEKGAYLVRGVRAADAPHAEGAAARMALRMRELAMAPSYTACAHLLVDDAFSADVTALPTTHVTATLMCAWHTLLLRAAELDCCEETSVSAGGHNRAVTAEVQSSTRKLQRSEGSSRDPRSMALLEVYAMFFLLASRMHGRLTATMSPCQQPEVHQLLLSEQRRLRSLKQEVAAYWAAVWADEVMVSEPVLRCSTASEAEAIGARIDKYCRSGADGGGMPSLTFGPLNLREHLRRAQARMQTTSNERSASCSSLKTSRSSEAEDCGAAAELVDVHKEISAQLRDACARMTLRPRVLTAEGSARPQDADAHINPEQAWSLWPPAASEAYRLRASMRESLRADALVTVTLRHPVSVVAYLRAWQREHEPVLESRLSSTSAARPVGSVRTSALSAYNVEGAACVVLPAVCVQSSPAVPRNDAQRISLMDVWRAVDAFEGRGCLVLACMPRGSHGHASECGVTCGRGEGAISAGPFQGGLESAAGGGDPAGAGLVMQAFFDVVSREDARLQKGQQQLRRQRAGRPSEKAPSADALVLLSVLRQLRQRLLPPPAGKATVTVPGACGREMSSAAPLAGCEGDMARSVSQWAAFVPLSHTRTRSTPPTRRSGGSGDADTDPWPSGPLRDDTAWSTYLHILHLCGDGLRSRAARRRGRRAAPSAATVTHVAHQLQRLMTLARLEEQTAHPSVPSARRSRLLSDEDSERIICFQIRGLQRIRDHVRILGWTVEQHMELLLAQESVLATVTAVCALQGRPHRDGECSLGEGSSGTVSSGCAGLSRRPPRRVAPGAYERPVNRVEQATAACFYPALAHLLRQRFVATPSSRTTSTSAPEASTSRLVFPLVDRTPRAPHATTAVVTEFGGAAAASAPRQHGPAPSLAPQTTATTATAESDRVASTLLTSIHAALSEAREQGGHPAHRHPICEAAHPCPTPTPGRTCNDLHALLSAVVAAVQRRSRDADPRLLFAFLSGRERDALWPLWASAEASYLELMMESVGLAGSTCSTTQHGHRVLEAGLTLYALVRPWLPLSSAAKEACAMEAALCLVTLALQRHKPLNDARGAAIDVDTAATSLPYLLQAVLVDILHGQQSVRLSARSIVLLGAIYSQLQRWEDEGATTPQVEAGVLLWRILRSLGALSEKDAAEVRDAWSAESEASIAAWRPGAADYMPSRVSDNAAPPSVSDTIRPCTELDCTRTDVGSGPRIIHAIYHGSLQVLCESGSSDGTAEAECGRWRSPLLLAVTRLRTWLACEEIAFAPRPLSRARSSESAAEAALHASTATRLALPQLGVLEDVLCLMLNNLAGDASGARRAHRGDSEREQSATRHYRRAFLSMYGLYAEIKRALSLPPWRGQSRRRQPKRARDGDGSQHCDGGGRLRDGCGADVGDVASLLLEVAVVAALSATEAARPWKSASAISGAWQLTLLTAFVSCCNALGTPLPSSSYRHRRQRSRPEQSLATPVATHVTPPEEGVLACVGVDMHAAVRHLAARLLPRLSEGMPFSAFSASGALQDWRGVLTALRAVQRVTLAFSVPETGVRDGGEGGDAGAAQGGVLVLSTSTAGLLWAPQSHEDFCVRKSEICLEAPSHGADHASRGTAALEGHQAVHSQGRHRHMEQALHSMYYATLRLLCRTQHLLALPLPVLLKELLHPLAELERAAAKASTLSPNAADATPSAVRSTAPGCDDSAAGRNWKVADRLAELVEVAQQVSTHPALRESASSAGPHSGFSSLGACWTTAWLVFMALAQVEEGLFAQCEPPRSSTGGGGLATRATAAFASPSRLFASRYVDLLAQRGTYAADYLAFLLVVSHHCYKLLPMHDNGLSVASQAEEERRVQLRRTQLRHVVAVAAAPSAVGAVMRLFQLEPSPHPLRAATVKARPFLGAAFTSTAAPDTDAKKGLPCAHEEERASSEARLPLSALTPDEEALLHRLNHLLQTARGQSALPCKGRGGA
ncbi:hypothetical protein LSCM1_07174 [Leishmania martiniquensis]|uniref:Uncharacterized protein n=1 Tax=Leishmania martiniquensis TaxID=1580590 RepID=A0A836HQM2_9TRYP|nr:hypothetical protein LSCM1_07174 [Leishmania martiniquensis]